VRIELDIRWRIHRAIYFGGTWARVAQGKGWDGLPLAESERRSVRERRVGSEDVNERKIWDTVGEESESSRTAVLPLPKNIVKNPDEELIAYMLAIGQGMLAEPLAERR